MHGEPLGADAMILVYLNGMLEAYSNEPIVLSQCDAA
jgi:hypothetical protein